MERRHEQRRSRGRTKTGSRTGSHRRHRDRLVQMYYSTKNDEEERTHTHTLTHVPCMVP